MTAELSACPFCGAQPKLETHVEWDDYSAADAAHSGMGYSAGSIRRETWELVCECGIRIKSSNDELLAQRWNRRAEPVDAQHPQYKAGFKAGFTFAETHFAPRAEAVESDPAQQGGRGAVDAEAVIAMLDRNIALAKRQPGYFGDDVVLVWKHQLTDARQCISALAPRAEAVEPQTGNWIAADDVYRMARDIDVALNGEAGAAKQPALCDVTSQIKQAARELGRPLLAESARWFVSGPSMSFFADDANAAEKLLAAAGVDRDDWTITDLRAPT